MRTPHPGVALTPVLLVAALAVPLALLPLNRRRLDLCEVAREMVAERVARHGEGIRFGLSGAHAWVDADPVRVRQIVDNLLENAVRYGGRRIDVFIEQTPEGNALHVVDDGQGIPPELLARLFQPFVQGEQALERPHGGLGLGLALASHLARLHGGTLSASSAGVGKGSRFTLLLPTAVPPTAKAGDGVRGAEASVPRRIVVIDDTADARETLRTLLENCGHQVSVAENGARGLALIQAAKPDVALLDIGLPGLDGYELARRVKAMGLEPAPVLIALTGYGQLSDKDSAIRAGFDAHLTKPFSFGELLRLIDELLSTGAVAPRAEQQGMSPAS